jgi:threonine synthase
VEDGRIGRTDSVVVLATATGLKDPATAAAQWPEVPVVPPELDSALPLLREAYGAGELPG